MEERWEREKETRGEKMGQWAASLKQTSNSHYELLGR